MATEYPAVNMARPVRSSCQKCVMLRGFGGDCEQVRAKERALREREAGLQAGEAAAAKYCAKDSALEQREAALAEREAAMARATAAAEYARSEAETLWRSHKVCTDMGTL